ncbi:Cytohesin-1 [Dimargaris verticillata]|uniref:Cytohesin-1 n=1 Tax=Dimargaris verticillata TaxID=2761393 RepID=A0A9W8B5A4_9FUNG|nr:Cytohesin-1 [Dimargaris verticillata]
MSQPHQPGRANLGLGRNTMGHNRRPDLPPVALGSTPTEIPDHLRVDRYVDDEAHQTTNSLRLLGVRHASMPIPATMAPDVPNLPPSPRPTSPHRHVSNPPNAHAASVPTPMPETPSHSPASTAASPNRRRFRTLTPRSLASLGQFTRKWTSPISERAAPPSSQTTGATSPTTSFRVIHSSPRSPRPFNTTGTAQSFPTGACPPASPPASPPLGAQLASPLEYPKSVRNDFLSKLVGRHHATGTKESSFSNPLSGQFTLTALPRELIYIIFRYLDSPKDLIACSQVCTTWRFPALLTYRDVMKIHPFANMSLLKALRKRLRQHHAPVSMALLDDIIYDLAQEYCRCNPEVRHQFGPDRPVDEVYSLLWTFIFMDREFRNPAVRRKISCQYFVKLVQGSYNQEVYTKPVLKAIFREIKAKPILDRHIPVVTSAMAMRRDPTPLMVPGEMADPAEDAAGSTPSDGDNEEDGSITGPESALPSPSLSEHGPSGLPSPRLTPSPPQSLVDGAVSSTNLSIYSQSLSDLDSNAAEGDNLPRSPLATAMPHAGRSQCGDAKENDVVSTASGGLCSSGQPASCQGQQDSGIGGSASDIGQLEDLLSSIYIPGPGERDPERISLESSIYHCMDDWDKMSLNLSLSPQHQLPSAHASLSTPLQGTPRVSKRLGWLKRPSLLRPTRASLGKQLNEHPPLQSLKDWWGSVRMPQRWDPRPTL